MGKALTVTISPRLHLGLISMHAGGLRKNGGIGFAISGPRATVKVEKGTGLSIEDHRDLALNSREIETLSNLVLTVCSENGLDYKLRVSIHGGLKTHVGMGSGTGIRLAILEGIFRLNGRKIDRSALILASKRGGTSGVGINTYFDGGLILDLGVPQDNLPLGPSSVGTPARIPIALPRVAMPAWPMCLCLPNGVTPKTQNQEVEFFDRVAPIRPAESFEAGYHSLVGVYAAAIERNIDHFCKAINYMQLSEWKRQEWAQYGSDLQEVALSIKELGAESIGMSSLGPLLFCIGDQEMVSRISAQASNLQCEVIPVRPTNSGRVISM